MNDERCVLKAKIYDEKCRFLVTERCCGECGGDSAALDGPHEQHLGWQRAALY